MPKGTHDALADPRNARVKIYVNGRLVPRVKAVISVFDAGFILGDGVWEGVRLHNGRIAFLDRHLDRLDEGAKAIALDIGKSRQELTDILYRIVHANKMTSGVHIRLMVTRGIKKTPSQDPRLGIGPATIVVAAEHKTVNPGVLRTGIRLITSSVRRGYPDVQDPKLNSHSKLNCITALIQAHAAGMDEALMLDPHGFVSTCNATHFFIVRKGEVWTSTGMYCLAGITRRHVLELCHENGIPAQERSFSLTETYSAEEAFCTGTFGGLTPVVEIDGRRIGTGRPGPMTRRLSALYRDLIERECALGAPRPRRVRAA
jgi:branched-chain amino acid aminotransferase